MSTPQVVLVTGGAGYIGSGLVRLLLRAGLRVRVLDNLTFGGEALLGVLHDPNFQFIHGDLRRSADVRAAVNGVTSVVHLAAIVGDPACKRSPELARAVNAEASDVLLQETLRVGGQRFVFSSTCSNYGRMGDLGVCDETSPMRPVSLYAELKVAFEERLMKLEAEPLVTVCLRFATAYGLSARPRFDLTVNEFTRDLYFRKRLEVYGEHFWRPYCHVADIARACYLALVAPPDAVDRQAFNVGNTAENYRKQDLVEMILQRLPDRGDLVTYVHRDEDPRDYRVNCDRVHDSLGFIPQWKVTEGIDEMIGALAQGMIKEAESGRYRNL